MGFTLFFGVLDIIKFSHGDVLMIGAFAGLTTFLGLEAIGIESTWVQLVAIVVIAAMLTGFLGSMIGKYLVLPHL